MFGGKRITEKEITELCVHLREAMEKFQEVTKDKITQEDIEASEALVKEYVTYTLDRGCGGHYSLASLLHMALYGAKSPFVGNDCYRPEEINSHKARSREIIKTSPFLSRAVINSETIDRRVPFVELLIDGTYLGAGDGKGQRIYDSEHPEKMVKEYELKSDYQVHKEYEEKSSH